MGELMKTILVVEDNELNRELMNTILSTNGYEVLSADNALSAVDIARESLPNIILMDIKMPGIDGYGALDLLKEDALSRDIPVIAVTGKSTPHDIEKIRSRGFDDYLGKPFRIHQLLSVVNDAI